jgi:hypothetical protein
MNTKEYEMNTKEYEMNTQIPLQRSPVGTNKLVIAGGILLMCGIPLFLSAEFGVIQYAGVPYVFLGVLSLPATITGLMFVFLGLVRKIKQGSLRWLRITLTLLCSSILVVVGLYILILTLLAYILLFSRV